MDGDKSVGAGFVAVPKRAFISSQFYYGNLGGLVGADAKCQALANAVPSLTGKTFKAWLSDRLTAAKDRLTHAAAPYLLMNSIMVANNWDDLTDGVLQNPITIDEKGALISTAKYVWTNTNADGTAADASINSDCQDWTVTSSSMVGVAGFSPDYTTSRWTRHSYPNCATMARLYCVEQ